MGSVSYRHSALKGENLPLEDAIVPNPRRDSLVRQGSLRRAFSRAKDALYRRKAPTPSAASLEHGKVARLRDRAPLRDMEVPRRESLQGQGVEIIEILDDDPEDEIVSVDSYADARESLASMSIQSLSNSVSPTKNREVAGGYGYGAARSPDEDDWGFEIEKPSQELDHSWEDFNPKADSVIDAAGHDWREFLDLDDDVSLGSPQAGVSPEPGLRLSDGRVADNQFRTAPGMAETLVKLKVECVDNVLALFPDICRDYVTELYDTQVGETAEQLIAHILDKLDGGTEYPKAKDKLKTLKRKREDEEAVNKYSNVDRGSGSVEYAILTRNILSTEFPLTPMSFIDSVLQQTRQLLFPAYMVLEEADRIWDIKKPLYNKIKKPRSGSQAWTSGRIESALTNSADMESVLRELQAARKARKMEDDRRNAERQAEIDEQENFRKAETEGTLLECGCCFGDFPLNRMVHCDNDEVPHWFCRQCAKQTAETEIGNSKYKIKCMSMDDCHAGFSRDMKTQFLDEKTSIALDRNEQEEMLRVAGIENLASCPFCPFAAEYPPVEQDRLFRCQAPDCEKVSCRLCKLESHIPKTCEENAKENGLSIRRQIEEAMSAALIRRCNKCSTPFVKEEGCNKMTCTRSGCFNVQCYVCSKSCSYDHFNDRSRGGKLGNCPLFESVEERHQEEVKKAETEALAKVRAEHPEYTEDDLKVKVSENVRKDEERRKASDPRNHLVPGVAHRVPAAGVFPLQAQVPRPRPGRGVARRRAVERPVPVQNIAAWPWLPIDPIRENMPEQVIQLQAPPVGQRAEIPDLQQNYDLDGEWPFPAFPAPAAGGIPLAADLPDWHHDPGGDLAAIQDEVEFLLGFPAGFPPPVAAAQIPGAQGPVPLELPERMPRFFPAPRLAPAGGGAQQVANENPPQAARLPGRNNLHGRLLEIQHVQRQQMERLRQIPRMRDIEQMEARIRNSPLQVPAAPPIPGHMPLRLSPRR